MKATFLSVLTVCLVVLPHASLAQEDMRSVEESLSQFRSSFGEAWARRDVEALGLLMTEDIDWVTSTGRWLKGREAFKEHHTTFFAQQFQNATGTRLDERVQFIGSDVAYTIGVNRNEGETFADGSPRPSRTNNGLRVYVRQDGRWLLKLAHNTILTPPATPTAGPATSSTPSTP